MKRRPDRKSIDGFVPRKPRASFDVGVTPRMARPSLRPSIDTAPPPRPTRQQVIEEDGSADVTLRLVDINDEGEQQSRRHFFGRRRVKHSSEKKPRRIMKKLGVGFVVIGILLGGFLLWKVIKTGAQVLQGNPLGILQKQRLKEDKNGRTNVLIFGTSGWSMEGDDWDGAMLTDSIMVVSINQTTHGAYTISLPRDLYVGTCTSTGKLNEVYWCAQQDGKTDEQAAQAFQKEAGEVLGLDVQYYVHANWKALVQGIDAVGGVDIKVEGSDGNGVYDIATDIKYSEGEIAHLNGERALAFARARNSEGGYGLSGGNFDREKNQRKMLSALQKKATSAGVITNPSAVSKLLDALGDNLRTNFQTNEVQTLIDLAKNTTKITSLPFVGRSNGEPDLFTTGMVGSASVVLPSAGKGDYSDIHAYLQKSFLGDLSATLDVLNGSSVTGLAQKKATELETLGFTVEAIDNAPSEISTNVQIYQINAAKTKAADRLKQHYGISNIQTGAPSGYTPSEDTDFVLIFGGTEAS